MCRTHLFGGTLPRLAVSRASATTLTSLLELVRGQDTRELTGMKGDRHSPLLLRCSRHAAWWMLFRRSSLQPQVADP